MKRWMLLVFATLLIAGPAAGQTVNKIAAVVNDEVITQYDLDQAIAAVAPMETLTPLQKAELRSKVKKQLIDDALIAQRMEELGLSVSEEQLENAINDIRQKNNLTQEQFRQALLKQGMTWPAYRERLRREIQSYQLMNREVYSKVEVTDQEVSQQFLNNIDQYRLPPTVELNRLSLSQGGKTQTELMNAAVQARQRLLAGDSLEAVAEGLQPRFDVQAGRMGEVDPQQLTADYADVVSQLKGGDISRPIQTETGIDLLQVVKRNTSRVQSYDEVKGEIRQELLNEKRQDKARTYIDELRKKAYISLRP